MLRSPPPDSAALSRGMARQSYYQNGMAAQGILAGRSSEAPGLPRHGSATGHRGGCPRRDRRRNRLMGWGPLPERLSGQ